MPYYSMFPLVSRFISLPWRILGPAKIQWLFTALCCCCGIHFTVPPFSFNIIQHLYPFTSSWSFRFHLAFLWVPQQALMPHHVPNPSSHSCCNGLHSPLEALILMQPNSIPRQWSGSGLLFNHGCPNVVSLEFQAVEYYTEWSLNPDNVVFMRVQTGIYDPTQIGDKPRWYAHHQQKTEYHVCRDTNHATLSIFKLAAKHEELPTGKGVTPYYSPHSPPGSRKVTHPWNIHLWTFISSAVIYPWNVLVTSWFALPSVTVDKHSN